MDLRYTVTPVEGKDVIGYQLTGPGVDDARHVLGTRIAQLGDQIVRAQLIAAGWTPPGERSDIERKDALLRQCLKHVASNISMTSDGTETEELYDAITKELQ